MWQGEVIYEILRSPPSSGQHWSMASDSTWAKSLKICMDGGKIWTRISLGVMDLQSSTNIKLHHILWWTGQQARILTLPLGICAKNALDLILGGVLCTHSWYLGRSVDKDGWWVENCWAISWQPPGRSSSNATILLFLSNWLNPGAWWDRDTPHFFQINIWLPGGYI